MRCARDSADVVSRAVETGDMIRMRGDSVIVEGDDYRWWRGGGEDPEEDGGNRGCGPVGRHAILEFSGLGGISVRPGRGKLGSRKSPPMLDCSYIRISPYTESAAGLNQFLLPNFAQAVCVACQFRPFVSSYISEASERREQSTYRWKDKRPGRCYLARVSSALVVSARKTWLRRLGALSEALSVDSVTRSSAQKRWCIACEAISGERVFTKWHREPYQTAPRATGTEITASQFIVGVE